MTDSVLDRQNIDELKAGPELDKLIAKHVFGVEVGNCVPSMWGGGSISSRPAESGFYFHCRYCGGVVINGFSKFNACPMYPFPKYSSDIAEAWKVLERFGGFEIWNGRARVRDFIFQLDPDAARSTYYCTVFDAENMETVHHAVADSAPLAICRAALGAIVGEPLEAYEASE